MMVVKLGVTSNPGGAFLWGKFWPEVGISLVTSHKPQRGKGFKVWLAEVDPPCSRRKFGGGTFFQDPAEIFGEGENVNPTPAALRSISLERL